MAIVVTTDAERVLLRTSRTGLGLLNAMFAEAYCAELAHRTEVNNKLSTTFSTVFSTAAAASLLQILAPSTAPYLAVVAAIVSAVATTFAWRSRAIALVKAAHAYGDLVVDWTGLWDTFKATQVADTAAIEKLERKNNEIGQSVAPIRMNDRVGRKLQQRIRNKVGLT